VDEIRKLLKRRRPPDMSQDVLRQMSEINRAMQRKAIERRRALDKLRQGVEEDKSGNQ
jgi:hypothetical protein